MAKQYWLMKSEPDAFSWEDLKREPNRTAMWDGVRNYKARNYMRDAMRPGDGVLFYHSSCKPPHVAGIAEVAKAAYPDPTQFDPDSKYYDPKSDPADPRWWLVDVKAVKDLSEPIPLDALKETPGLEDMVVNRRGMRLSVQPVTAAEWKIVTKLVKTKAL